MKLFFYILSVVLLLGCSGGSDTKTAGELLPPDVTVARLAIVSTTVSLPVGLDEQLKADALLSNDQVLDVTSHTALNWSSSNPAIATVENSGPNKGRVTGVAMGTVTLTASGVANGQSFTASTVLAITDAVVTDLRVTSAISGLPVGLNTQLKADAVISNGQVLDVTRNAILNWVSSNPGIATVENSGPNKGRVSALARGTVTLTATGTANGRSFSANTVLDVTDAVVTQLQVSAATPELAAGLSTQLGADALLSDGRVLAVTNHAALNWSSDNLGVATVENSGPNKGRVTGIAVGTVTLTAAGVANGQSFTASTVLKITDAVVTQLQVSAETSALPVGLSTQLRASALLSNERALDVTNNAALGWSSSDPKIATVENSGPNQGRVTGIGVGKVTLTAAGMANGQSFTDSLALEITDAVVTDLQVTAAIASLPARLSTPLKANAILSDGRELDVTSSAVLNWSSSHPEIATVENSGPNKGRVTGVAVGTVTLTAAGMANNRPFTANTELEIIDTLPVPDTGSFSSPDGFRRMWANADNYCRTLIWSGQDDWRLPSMNELTALYNQYPNNQLKTILGWPTNFVYWSATLFSPNAYYYADLSNGRSSGTNDVSDNYVTCIR
ncbi:Ig-like domain-containing protein [Aeromonas cavernicola]|uniref:BIG2 domain-containing protein n=1 Tax=Aeromonas cavernicola TaxID=1006623 RepID=A0A2H9U8Y7_9GAMM|nr:Ig-like domain-containing protein [Aeromonas cavernicola]PJG60449.1 hypothetical protein CUC53_02050 [Aeromonas cavernicola]